MRPERTEHAVKLATSSPSFGNRAEKMETVNFIVGYFACKVAPLIILSKKMHRLNFKICSYNGNISWASHLCIQYILVVW